MSLSDEELHRLVEHLAELHGVSPKQVVAEVTGEELDDELPVDEPASAAEPAESKRRGRAHWAAWVSALVVVGVLVGAIVVAFMKFVTGPAQADIKPGEGLPSPSVAVASTDQLVGITFILTFPHQFDQVQNLKPDTVFSEQYRIGSKTDYRRLITVSVRNTNGGTLDDDASFKMRSNEPDLYKLSVRKVAGEAVSLMTKSGDGEQTMFWLHQGKLLTIAVTSTDPEDSVDNFMNQIMTNIRWKT